MSIVKVTLPGGEIPVNGKQVSFVAPCDCTNVEGLSIEGEVYTVVDAMGQCVTGKGGAFCAGSVVSVILNVEDKKAFIQNLSTYTKEETLSSSTKTALGLGEDAVPDDAFASLGWHTWRRRAEESGYVTNSVVGDKIVRTLANTSVSTVLYYSDSYTITENEKFLLDNPSSITFNPASIDSTTFKTDVAGKYLSGNSGESSYILLMDSDASKINTEYELNSEGKYAFVIKGQTILTRDYYENIGEYEYVTSPNRHAYPDSGREGIFTYEYLGAPLSNAKEAYGLRLHWWKRRTEESGYALAYGAVNSVSFRWDATRFTSKPLYYSNNASIDDNNKIILSNPSSVTVNVMSTTNVTIPKGSYVSEATDGSADVYFVFDQPITRFTASAVGDGTWYVTTNQSVQKVAVEEYTNIGECEYVSSPDRNAYPDSGNEGIFSYQYLGVPFENAREGAKIVTGSYAGTGTYGSGNDNTLTFESTPKLLFIACDPNVYRAIIMTIGGGTVMLFGSSGSGVDTMPVSYTENSISWRNTSSAEKQLNKAGVIYEYIAIL